MLTIEKLKEIGVDTEMGLTRCMNNEAFYFRLVGMSVQDANFAKLQEAIASHDLDAAFEASHALKGVLGNLALTPLFRPASEMCELLRNRTEMDYEPLLDELMQAKVQLDALLAE